MGFSTKYIGKKSEVTAELKAPPGELLPSKYAGKNQIIFPDKFLLVVDQGSEFPVNSLHTALAISYEPSICPF